MNIKRKFGKDAELLWSDKKRHMGLPLSVTRYYLVRKPGAWVKVFTDVGLTYSEIEETNVYRIRDVSFSQSLFGKMFNTGTVTLISSDSSDDTIVLKNIKNPYNVRDMFATIIEEERALHGVKVTEHQRG